MKKPSLGVGMILLSGFLWGLMGIFVRYLSALGLSSIQISALRVALATLAALPVLLLFGRPYLRPRRRHIPFFIGGGVLSLLGFSIFYFRAIQLTSLSTAAVLSYTFPVLCMLESAVLLHEKMTKNKILACLCAFAGCALVSGGIDGSVPPMALITGLLSAVCFSLYGIFGRLALERGCHPFTMTFYSFLFASLGALPLCQPLALVKTVASTPAALGWGLALALISALAPYVLYTLGLRTVEAGRAAVMISFEPAVSALAGMILFDEALTLGGVGGMALIILAIVLCSRSGRKSKKTLTIHHMSKYNNIALVTEGVIGAVRRVSSQHSGESPGLDEMVRLMDRFFCPWVFFCGQGHLLALREKKRSAKIWEC